MPRTPLKPISGNSSRRKELTPYERGLIVGRSSGGASTAEIRKEFLVPESTIRSTISQAPHLDHGVSKPRSGRPRACSVRRQRHIIRAARAKPEITYQELIEQTGANCSKSTVYRILKEYGLTEEASAFAGGRCSKEACLGERTEGLDCGRVEKSDLDGRVFGGAGHGKE